MDHFECGELYEEGNCAGCGMPQGECPSYEPDRLRLVYLTVTGEVMHETTISNRLMTDVMQELTAYVWPFHTKVHAVRVYRGNSQRAMFRRPPAADGPGRLPVVGLRKR